MMAPGYRQFFRKHVYRVNVFVSRNTNNLQRNLQESDESPKILDPKISRTSERYRYAFLTCAKIFLTRHVYIYIFEICSRGVFGRSETSLMNSLTSLHELYDPDCLVERHIVGKFLKFAAFLLHNCKFTGCDRNGLSVTGNRI